HQGQEGLVGSNVRAALAPVLTLAVLVAGCTKSSPQATSPITRSPSATTPSEGTPSTIPPVPSASSGSLGPRQPPIVWVGGALSALRSDRLELKEPFGSVVILHRLAGNATTFFEVRDGAWEQV